MTDTFDPVEFGKSVGDVIREVTAPLLKRIQELESRQLVKGDPGADGKNGQDGASVTVDDVVPLIAEQVKAAVEAIPAPKNGADGRDGTDGKDADPISVAEVAAELLATDGLKALVDLHVAEAVAALPKPENGKDGAQGPQGEPGDPGTKGDPGADGVGLAGAVIDREGALTLTLTNGETKSLGVIVGKDGDPGQNGKDGADFTDVEIDYDGERTLTIRGKGGEITKHLPIPLDRGYYRDGMKSLQGDVVTHDGNAWIAVADNDCKPCLENKHAWRMLARKGRDGRDGVVLPPAGPVKLGDGND